MATHLKEEWKVVFWWYFSLNWTEVKPAMLWLRRQHLKPQGTKNSPSPLLQDTSSINYTSKARGWHRFEMGVVLLVHRNREELFYCHAQLFYMLQPFHKNGNVVWLFAQHKSRKNISYTHTHIGLKITTTTTLKTVCKAIQRDYKETK